MKTLPLLMLLSCCGCAVAASLPDEVDLSFRDDPLIELLENLARKADAGLLVVHDLEDHLQQQVTIDVDDIPWQHVVDWLRKSYGIELLLVDGRLEIRDAARAQRDRLVVRTYDVRALIQGLTDYPAPELQIPEPGGTGAQLIPEIDDENPPEVGDIMEIIEERLPAESWDIDGTGLDELNGELVVIQLPEMQEQIEALLDEMEQVVARQIGFGLWRLPVAAAQGLGPVIDAAAWQALRPQAQQLAAFVQSDESRMHHFSGRQRAYIADLDAVGGAFDPITTIRALEGLRVDVQAHATKVGVLATIRLQVVGEGGEDGEGAAVDEAAQRAAEVSWGGEAKGRIETPLAPLVDVRDTRLIPDGGAAIFTAEGQAYALVADVTDFRPIDRQQAATTTPGTGPAPGVGRSD